MGLLRWLGRFRSVSFLTVFVVDSSETVQDHIGEPASSWRVASPSPDRAGSLHASIVGVGPYSQGREA